MDADKAKRWLRSVLYRAQLRARGQGVSFLLSEDDVRLPEHCPVLNIPLQYGSVAFDGAVLARRSVERDWIKMNTWVISRSAYGMLMNNHSLVDLSKPFDFLSESDRKRLYDTVAERRARQQLIEEFNRDFPGSDTAVSYPKWLASAPAEVDPVEVLRRELNEELT